jgi:DNA polymerase-3 subunit epsilon
MIDNITIFDFETTGLDPVNDRVIELAALRIRDGKIVGEFSAVIHHDIILESKITEITGIDNSDLVHGMDEKTAFRILNWMIGDSVIVAHNAAFDLAFLHFSLMRLANRTFDNPFIDTLTISRDRHVYPHKLTGDMCSRYEIALEGAHRALNDVHGCWDLLKKLHEEEPVNDYINLIGYLRKYGPPAWAPDYAVLEATENRYEKKTAG